MKNKLELVELNSNEMKEIQGGLGFVATFLAIGAVAGAGVAIYEAGKATGEWLYYATHGKK
jgi:lactobin A/cerein 7B family class IIb bacteriocin